jgi:hypothetical protein
MAWPFRPRGSDELANGRLYAELDASRRNLNDQVAQNRLLDAKAAALLGAAVALIGLATVAARQRVVVGSVPWIVALVALAVSVLAGALILVPRIGQMSPELTQAARALPTWQLFDGMIRGTQVAVCSNKVILRVKSLGLRFQAAMLVVGVAALVFYVVGG